MKPTDYPLCWPEGQARTAHRLPGRFRSTFEAAYDKLFDECEKLHDEVTGEFIISADVPLGAKGLPLVSAAKHAGDPGVAVYVWKTGSVYALACDTYTEVHHNMLALAHTISAMRTVARHGSAKLLEQSLSGFRTELVAYERPAPRLLSAAK
jgi:hypothetical protein